MSARNDSGQALALGVMGLLLLAVGMYMTMSFGRHVKEKIHVQTTADAVALSLAELEAQSFNYIAFANRAQVAHYVTMMNLQGYVSYASSMEHFTVTWANLFYTAEQAATICSVYPACASLKEIAAVFRQAFWTAYQFYSKLVDTIDPSLGILAAGFDRLNGVMWVTQAIMAGVVMVHLGLGGQEVFQKVTAVNDPTWSNTSANLALNLATMPFNTASYSKTFNEVGGAPFRGHKLGSDKHGDGAEEEVKRAQRVMTEVVNATRFDQGIIRRSLLPEILFGEGDSTTWPNFEDWVNDLGDKIPFFKGRMGGTSKLVGTSEKISDKKEPIDAIFSQQAGVGTLSRGDTMSSTDEWLWMKGSVWVKAGGQAGDVTSEHCRAKHQDSEVNLGGEFIKSLFSGSLSGSALVPECKTNQDGDNNHSYLGISPFMLYTSAGDPNQPGGGFHQPSVFIWLHKGQAEVGIDNAVSFRWKVGARSEGLDTRIGRSAEQLGFGGEFTQEITGIHAFARAEAYYHRPGNWAEPPSFFNPFWKARLAPVVDSAELKGSPMFQPLAGFLENTLIIH